MLRHPLRNARVLFGTVAICLVMLSGLAMPHAVSAEQLGNQSGSSYGQRFCALVGGTEVPDETFIEGSYGHITCRLADGVTILECSTSPGRLNECHLRNGR